MRRRAAILWLLLAASPIAASIDAADFARGAAAVGERPSDAIALRQAGAPSPSFRFGAAYRAWRNASAAIAFDASNSTGDGGDVEILAEDCSDERIAFEAVEAARSASKLTPDQVATVARLVPADAVAAWRTRLAAPPRPCRR